MIEGKNYRAYRLTAWAWLLVCLLLLVLVLFFPHTSYKAKNVFSSPFLLLPFGLVFFGLLYLLLKGTAIRKGLPLILGLVFLTFQIYCVKNYYFMTGWDSSNLLYAGILAPFGLEDEFLRDYFSYYPNNILLAFFYMKIFTVVSLHEKAWTSALETIIFIQCLLSFGTGLATFKVIEKLTGQRSTALWGYFAFLLLIGLSPWVSIAYSDSASLLFPILILWMYVSEPKNLFSKGLKWFGIGAVGFFGYHIKPTVIIPVIAIICAELYELFSHHDYTKSFKKALFLLLGILCAGVFIGQAVSAFPYEVDPEKRIGLPHFFAMGLNEDSMGVWAGDDVAYSKSFETVKERDAADWALAKERIESMKLPGLLRQWMRKLLTCFNDGTFAWTHEGNFFAEIFENDSKTAEITRSFYYSNGKNYQIFLNAEQAIWLSLLLLSLGAFFSHGKAVAVIEITLLGLILYLLLFEVRARYVYIFAPLIIVLAACSIQSISNPGFLKAPDRR